MRRAAALLLLLPASACVAPTEPAPPPSVAPPPAPPPPPPPAPPADWRDRAYAPGDWSYARTGGASEARYGDLALLCDGREGQLRLVLAGVAAGPVTFRTSSGDTVRQAQSGAAGAELALEPRDPLLDQIAFSRGRFLIAAGGRELVLPAWPEVQRVVEDCR
jgi:hypothetical protein